MSGSEEPQRDSQARLAGLGKRIEALNTQILNPSFKTLNAQGQQAVRNELDSVLAEMRRITEALSDAQSARLEHRASEVNDAAARFTSTAQRPQSSGENKLWSGMKWAASKIWSGMKWIGSKIWSGLQAIVSGIASSRPASLFLRREPRGGNEASDNATHRVAARDVERHGRNSPSGEYMHSSREQHRPHDWDSDFDTRSPGLLHAADQSASARSDGGTTYQLRVKYRGQEAADAYEKSRADQSADLEEKTGQSVGLSQRFQQLTQGLADQYGAPRTSEETDPDAAASKRKKSKKKK